MSIDSNYNVGMAHKKFLIPIIELIIGIKKFILLNNSGQQINPFNNLKGKTILVLSSYTKRFTFYVI